ncbi:hypothetical protein ANO11243_073360 [Dothideomycetidae sp. 11243]|nr:hypothetical protein ANO11243_073360 [fungal sp. No.11243]
MSKRRRTDYEGGVQSASGTRYGDGSVAEQISYDDEVSDAETPATPPGPYSYAAEKRREGLASDSVDHDDQGFSNGGRRVFDRPRIRTHRPEVSHHFGQISAFPEPVFANGGTAKQVGDSEGGELEDQETGSDVEGQVDRDAWEYLRSVRIEAEGLPSVYRAVEGPAPDASSGKHGTEQSHTARISGQYGRETSFDAEMVIYDDGACIARPRTDDEVKINAVSAAQEAYYKALKGRFARHRAMMRREIQAGSDSSDTEQQCTTRLEALESPDVAIIARLGLSAALRLIVMLDEQLDACLLKSNSLPPVLGRWTWALLGTLADVGELSSPEVGVVRDLAKRAAWGMNWLRMVESNGQDVLEAARRRALGLLDDSDEAESGDRDVDDASEAIHSHSAPEDTVKSVDTATMTMLHLIVTVVGEFYGQRDLLDSRLPWSEGV